MDNESIHSDSEFYLYPEEQDKENDERSGNFNILEDEENNDNNNLDEIQEFIDQQRPINTTKKTTYDLNVWKRYCDIVHESRKFEEIPANELNILRPLDITLSINFSYTAERRPAFIMDWKFLLILRGKNIYVIHRPGSVRIGKNCALDLENVFKTSGTVFSYPDRIRPVNNIYILFRTKQICFQ